MTDAAIGWLLIGVMALAVYFGVPALVKVYARILADARAHRDDRQEELDELFRLEMLEFVEREEMEREQQSRDR